MGSWGAKGPPHPPAQNLADDREQESRKEELGDLGTSCSNLRPPGDCLRDLGQVMGLRTPCSDQVTRKRTASSRVFLRLVKQEARAEPGGPCAHPLAAFLCLAPYVISCFTPWRPLSLSGTPWILERLKLQEEPRQDSESPFSSRFSSMPREKTRGQPWGVSLWIPKLQSPYLWPYKTIPL